VKIVVLAGGVGTRLWPLSRRGTPKQLLNLFGERTMLQETVARVLPIVPADQVFVVTARAYARQVACQLPDVPPANIIAEPVGRGSGLAIGLAAMCLDGGRDDVLAFLPADHFIARPDVFRQVLVAAAAVAERGYLVTLGIRANAPLTGYGYIQQGDRLDLPGSFAAFKVARFTEKPSRQAAEEYLAAGGYSWNAGMFIGRATTFLQEIALHLPALARDLATIRPALGTPRERRVLNAVWPAVAPVTIDYGVMEKTRLAAVVPVDIGWSDVGDWSALSEVMPGDANGNVVRGEHVGLDTSGCLISGDGRRLIATVGLSDMVVVDAGDAILICPKDRSQEARELVATLKASGRERFV
jgi:mannose-1-phosphate guanylyltransferase